MPPEAVTEIAPIAPLVHTVWLAGLGALTVGCATTATLAVAEVTGPHPDPVWLTTT